MNLKALLVGVVLASAFTSANAVLTVDTGNNNQDVNNLVFNPCGLPSGSGLTVNGCLSNDHSIVADLSSDESIDFSGGQARVEAVDGSFSTLTIALTPLTKVVLNINASEDGFVTFSDGAGTSGAFELDANGQNFFTITAISGNSLTFVTSLTSGGAETDIVDDVRQIRLGQQEVTVIPEPETYVLMMAGLAAIGFIARRRKMRR